MFAINNKSAPWPEIDKNIEEFVKYYTFSLRIAYSFKTAFGMLVCSWTEVIKSVLRDYRKEYNHYLVDNDFRIKKIKEYFEFCTKRDGELDSKVKANLISEGKESGLTESDVRNLISKLIVEHGVKEVEICLGDAPFSKSVDDFLYKTYYEILGISEYADYGEIKAAYENEYEKYCKTCDRAKAKASWVIVSVAWDCLRDPIKRRDYDKNLRSHREVSMLHGDGPQLVVDRKDTYFFENIKRGTILTEKIIIKNPNCGLLLGTIKSDVPWIELDRNSILERHEQELSVRIVTAKIDTKLNKEKGNVIIDSNGGLHVVTFEVSIKN